MAQLHLVDVDRRSQEAAVRRVLVGEIVKGLPAEAELLGGLIDIAFVRVRASSPWSVGSMNFLEAMDDLPLNRILEFPDVAGQGLAAERLVSVLRPGRLYLERARAGDALVALLLVLNGSDRPFRDRIPVFLPSGSAWTSFRTRAVERNEARRQHLHPSGVADRADIVQEIGRSRPLD